jgi:hypothetical protein
MESDLAKVFVLLIVIGIPMLAMMLWASPTVC